jgi:hypothetical protein
MTKRKHRFSILFDGKPEPACEHINAVAIDRDAISHWCQDCGALQRKPGVRWKIPKNVTR